MKKASLFVFGSLAAVLSTACVSILGNFEVSECGSGETLQGDTCVPNTLAPGDDVTAKSCSDPKAPVCDSKRVCADSTGLAVCVCKPEYQGGDCGACGDGLQDNNTDGTCEKTCANANPTCSAHAACSDSTGTPQCTCALGYSTTNDAKCTFTGGPAGGDFSSIDNSMWTAPKGTVDPSAPGDGTSTGVLTLTPTDCNTPAGWGSIHQTFDMPSVAEAEPFALKVKAKAICQADASGCYGEINLSTSLSNDDLTLPSNAWTTLSQCLGEKAYGPNVDLTISNIHTDGESGFCYSPGRQILIDSIAIVPDPSCPAPGGVLNGNFEANGGWTASGTTAEVIASVGNNGSRGGRLAAATRGNDYPNLKGTISAPSSMPNAALVFSYKGTNGRNANLVFQNPGSYLSTNALLKGTGTYQDIAVCVPEYVKGKVSNIVLSLPDSRTSTTTQTSSEADPREFIFDDFHFESKPDLCPAEMRIFDPGFERDNPQGWLFSVPSYNAASYYSSGGAHGGSRYLAVYANYQCGSTSAYTTVVPPMPSGTAGPAIKFWYQLTKAGTASYSLYAGNAYQQLAATAAGTWTEGKLCVNSYDYGKPLNTYFYVYNGTCTSGQYGNYNNGGFLYVDDLTVENDPGCPVAP
jgi:hypothetical protein